MIADVLNAATLALVAAGAVEMIYGVWLWFRLDSDRKAKPKRKRGDLSRREFARWLIWLSAAVLIVVLPIRYIFVALPQGQGGSIFFSLIAGIYNGVWLLNGANGLTNGKFRFGNQWVYGQRAYRMGELSIVVGMCLALGLVSIDYGGAVFWCCGGAWLWVPGMFYVAATSPSDEKKRIDYDHPFWVFLRRGGSEDPPDKRSADHDR
jgi:hypothetical protein